MIKLLILLILLIGLYAIGFAGVTLWFLKMKGKDLETSVKQGAVWWKFVVSKIKEKINSSTIE